MTPHEELQQHQANCPACKGGRYCGSGEKFKQRLAMSPEVAEVMDEIDPLPEPMDESSKTSFEAFAEDIGEMGEVIPDPAPQQVFTQEEVDKEALNASNEIVVVVDDQMGLKDET